MGKGGPATRRSARRLSRGLRGAGRLILRSSRTAHLQCQGGGQDLQKSPEVLATTIPLARGASVIWWSLAGFAYLAALTVPVALCGALADPEAFPGHSQSATSRDGLGVDFRHDERRK